MSDSTIAAVANGGSPQPVKVQEASPVSKDQHEAVANEVTGDSGAPGDDLDSAEAAILAAEEAGKITKQEAQALKKKLLIKVDGQEMEEELSWDDEEGLKRHLQKSKAFDKRVKEYSTYKGQVDQFLKQLKDNPESVLEKMGFNIDEFAEKRLSKKVEEMSKSPEQLAREKMEQELDDLRKKMKMTEEQKEQSEMEKLRNEQAASIQSEIQTALESATTKLPKRNPFVVQKIAQNMILAMKNGYPEVTAKDVIPIVEKQWREELKSYFDTSSEDIIEELVGKENLNRYRKTRISAAKASGKQTQTAKQVVKDTGMTRKEEKPKEPKSFKKLFSYHDE